MDKKSINRKELNKNFLKQTIIRFDYDYLFPNQIEEIMEKLDSFFGTQNFTIEKRTKNDFQVNLNIDIEDNNEVNINNNQEEYSTFVNNEENVLVEITKNYAAITSINYKYVLFDRLNEIITKVVTTIKEVRSYIEIKSTGLRKINSLLIKDISKINDYFEKNMVSFSNFEINYFKKVENYDKKDLNISVNFDIQSGLLNNKDKMYQVLYDIDVVKHEVDTNEISEGILKNMNDIEFEVYKDGLTEKFLSKLINNEVNSEEVIFEW